MYMAGAENMVEWIAEREHIIDRLQELRTDHKEMRDQIQELKNMVQQIGEDVRVRAAVNKAKTAKTLATLGLGSGGLGSVITMLIEKFTNN